jgi:hypothetical protein
VVSTIPPVSFRRLRLKTLCNKKTRACPKSTVVFADVTTGFGVEGGRGAVAEAEAGSIRALLEQVLTIDAKLMLPASRSSPRRLTKSGPSSGRSGPGTSMASRYGRNFRSRCVFIVFPVPSARVLLRTLLQHRRLSAVAGRVGGRLTRKHPLPVPAGWPGRAVRARPSW